MLLELPQEFERIAVLSNSYYPHIGNTYTPKRKILLTQY